MLCNHRGKTLIINLLNVNIMDKKTPILSMIPASPIKGFIVVNVYDQLSENLISSFEWPFECVPGDVLTAFIGGGLNHE